MITDHTAQKWLHNLKSPTGRLARWALEFLEYDYEIIYRIGSLNCTPKALSRTSEKLNSIASTLSIVGEKGNEKLDAVKQVHNFAKQKQTIGKSKLSNKI